MLKNSTKILSSTVIAGCLTCTQTTFATDDAAELAKKLSNPVADIINMPFQLNYEWQYDSFLTY